MAQTSYPDPASGPNAVTDVKYEALMSGLVSDGLFGLPTDSPALFADGTGLQVKIRANARGAVRGYGWQNGATDDPLAIAANGTGNPRLDRVVLQLDRSTWRVRAVVKTGTPSATPVEPALQRDLDVAGAGSGKFECPLGKVLVAPGAASLASGTVTPEGYYTGEMYVCTSTTRPPNSLGTIIYESDTQSAYISTATAWLLLREDSGSVPVTPNVGWSTTGAGVRRINGVVFANIIANRTAGTLSSNTRTNLCHINDPAFFPRFTVNVMAYRNGGDPVLCTVGTNGIVTATSYPGTIDNGDLLTLTDTCWFV